MKPVPVIEPLGQQLIDAGEHSNVVRMGALLDQGVAVESRDGTQTTPLIWASYLPVAFFVVRQKGECECRG